jgi:hypothetical protein
MWLAMMIWLRAAFRIPHSGERRSGTMQRVREWLMQRCMGLEQSWQRATIASRWSVVVCTR